MVSRRRRALCAFLLMSQSSARLSAAAACKALRCAVLVLVHTAVPTPIDAGRSAGVRDLLNRDPRSADTLLMAIAAVAPTTRFFGS